jgi:integrase
MAHDVSEGFLRKIGTNWYWYYVENGQRKSCATKTSDEGEAEKFMITKRAEILKGVADSTSRLRFRDISSAYLASGKKPQASVIRDLDEFFGNKYVRTINVRTIEEFKTWRESLERVLETKAETLVKEIALRKLREPGKKPAEIAADAERWVEHGTRATTNKRLTILRAIFNFAVKRELIRKNEVPASFCLWDDVDNVRQGKFTEAQFKSILGEMPEKYHPYLRFLFGTGMRSGQAEAITWSMIGDDGVLRMPNFLSKNDQPYALPLKNEKGEPYGFAAMMLKSKKRTAGERVFDVAGLDMAWRLACDKIGIGVFDKKTKSFRGAKLHDFRRTAVYNMSDRGIGEGDGMSITGHRTASIYRRYGINDTQQQRRVLDKM